VKACLGIIALLQCIKQAQWPEDNPVLALPGMIQRDGNHEYATRTMGQLLAIPKDKLDRKLPNDVHVSVAVMLIRSLCECGRPFLVSKSKRRNREIR
jgi:hypothetical protein